jgi:hypothetical protein
MSSPLPPSNPTREAQYRKVVFAASLGALVLCPAILMLPPRKLDIYTVALIAGTAMGGNQVFRECTGRSIVERVRERAARAPASREGGTLPDAAQRRGNLEGINSVGEREAGGRDTGNREDRRQKGVLEVVWMGKEKANWKEERDAKERKALEEGMGYGGLIVDQIWEVWNGGREKAERAKEAQKVVSEERRKG